MALTQSICPHCETALAFEAVGIGTPVRCPACEETFLFEAEAEFEEEEEARPRRSKAIKPAKPKKKVQQEKVSRKGILVGAGVMTLVVLVLGMVGAVTWKAVRNKKKAAESVAEATKPQEEAPKPPRKEDPPKDDADKPTDKTPEKPPENPTPQPVKFEPPAVPKEKPFLTLEPGGHTAKVSAVFFTKDGKKVITASLDKSVRMWDADSGECLSIFRLPAGPGREGGIQFADVAPDNSAIAVAITPYESAQTNGLLYLVSLQTGQILTGMKFRETVSALAYSPDGKWLAVSNFSGLIQVLDTKSEKMVGEFRGHTQVVCALAWSPNSQLLASASADMTACIWSPASVKPLAVLKKHKDKCDRVAWHPSGRSLVSAGSDGQLCFWSSSGQALQSYTYQEKNDSENIPFRFTTLAYSKNGKDLLYGGVCQGGKAGIIDSTNGKQRLETTFHDNSVQAGSVSPDGQLAITTGGSRHETILWKVSDGEMLTKFQAPSRSHWGVGWSPDGKSIAWGSVPRGSSLRGATPLEHSFSLETFEPTGKPTQSYNRNVTSAGDVQLDVSDPRKVRVTRQGKAPVTLTLLSPQDLAYTASLLSADRALVGGAFGEIYLFDTQTSKILRTYKYHTSEVTGIAHSPDGKYFISSSTDETVRVWTQERDDPVLSFFMVGSEWIAWTPEGYYASSTNGERLMGWQVNEGLLSKGKYYSAMQFRASLYQPGAMKILLKCDSLSQALEKAGVSNQVQIGQVLPPSVEIVSPKLTGNTLEVSNNTLEVKAVAHGFGTHPITSMRLLLDGRPYLGQKGLKKFDGRTVGQVEAVWKVALTPGPHTIAVSAESPVSKGLSTVLEVERSGGKDELPNLYILAIGISEYPGKLKLNFAASDADLLVRTFQAKTKGVFNKVEVLKITDKAATKQAIMEGMDWLASKMSPVDVGIFFFSGHGCRDKQGQFFLVPVNVSKPPPSTWGVSGDYIKETLGNMPGRMVAMLDACHSGSVADEIEPSSGDNLIRELMTDEYGVIVLCSSLSVESSLESTQTKAGFFTFGLVEGINGKADFNRDKLIHLSELSHYSSLRVQQLSGGEQNPTVGRPQHVKSFVIAKP